MTSDTKKTAVIVIHGIGEQQPMATLWSFLGAAWLNDPDLVDPNQRTVYSKPGRTPDNYELRRITTRSIKGPSQRKLDFYEYYWAHMMTGNTLAGVKRWLLSLFFRMPWSIPPGYLGHWILGWSVALAALAGYVWWAYGNNVGAWAMTGFGTAITLLVGVMTNLLVPKVGDAARYLRAEPGNIAARQQIRENGVALIDRLHASGEYDRVVMVGHSLGSVIAYDILTYAWADIDGPAMREQHRNGSALMEKLTALEAAGVAVIEASGDGAAERVSYRNAQRAYRRELAAQEKPVWFVSDLITLGSPLGKAELLLAEDVAAFEQRKERREFPTCPPVYEYWARDAKRFSYPKYGDERVPHHAAPFAPTVWTNIYFPTRLLVLGDPISGAVAPRFGQGITDIVLRNRGLRFQHCDYWTERDDAVSQETIAALRNALNLRDKDEDL